MIRYILVMIIARVIGKLRILSHIELKIPALARYWDNVVIIARIIRVGNTNHMCTAWCQFYLHVFIRNRGCSYIHLPTMKTIDPMVNYFIPKWVTIKHNRQRGVNRRNFTNSKPRLAKIVMSLRAKTERDPRVQWCKSLDLNGSNWSSTRPVRFNQEVLPTITLEIRWYTIQVPMSNGKNRGHVISSITSIEIETILEFFN